jgi:hypothetical protein
MKALFQSLLPACIALFMGVELSAQCTNIDQWPSSSVAINTAGGVVTISTCNYAGEYSVITGAVSGQTLQFTYSLTGGFITVRSGSVGGPVLASGNSPLSFNNTFTGTLYVHWNTDSACGSNATCSTTTVQCTSCTPPPPPANDDCAGAIAFPTIPNDGTCANATVTTVGATGTADPVCTGTEDDDVWFTFTTPAGVTSLLYTNTNISGNTDRVLQIYSGTCAGLTSIGCYDPESGTITGLAGSTTYRLRVYTWGTGVTTTFNLCLRTPPAAPANDNCAGAFPVAVNPGLTCTSVTAGTVASATASPGPTSSCGTYDDDVWFSFVATATTHLIELLNVTGSATDLTHQVLSSCGAATALVCSDPNTSTVTGLTIGQTYYIRVATFTSTPGQTTSFNVCVKTQPPPPTCPGGLGAGTVNIASLPYNGVGLTNCGNGNNITSANATVCGSTSYYGGEDRTFIFTPTVTGVYDIILTTASTWTGLMLYAGCPFLGQGGSCVAQSQSSTGNKTLNVNLTAGTTYYLVVDAFPSPSCHPSFNLSIASAIPPCTAPGTPMVSNISSNSATVSWAAAPGALTYDWTVGTGASCPTGTGANTAATSLSLSGLVPNTTYRVCVRTSTCGGGAASGYVTTTFTTAPLPNDACAGAITVSCGQTVNGSTVGALSDAAVGSCGIGTGGTPGNGVWYKLAGDGSQVTASLCASAYDTKIHVYSGSCAGLTCVASNDDACGLQSQVVFNTTAGVDYYILVNGFLSATGAFSLNIGCVCGAPLGTPWTTTNIGGAVGQSIDNVCGGSIDLQSNGFSSSLASDKLHFASQNLCGNQTMTVKVNNVTNGGFAGIMFRESTAAGSKLVAIKTQLGNFVHREIRTTTNGAKQTQQFMAIGHSWLRLERNGNTFIGYRSNNGMAWQQVFVVTALMTNCMEVGLFVEGVNVNATAQAVFSNVSIGSALLAAPAGEIALDIHPLDFSLFPNPAQSEINVKMGEELIGKEVTIRISNQLGQTVLTRRLGEVQHPVENIQLSNLPDGMYIMTLQTEGIQSLTKKFIVGLNRP